MNIADYEVTWYMWPQLKKPINDKLKEYILNLDTKKNVKILQSSLTFRPICLRNYRIAETTLIECVKMDFNLFEIAKIFYRDDREDGDEEQGSSKRPATDETALSSVAEDEAIRPADVEAARQLVEEEAQAGLEALAQYGSSSESDEDVRMRD